MLDLEVDLEESGRSVADAAPCIRVGVERPLLGGAANAALAHRMMGADCLLVGVVGDDAYGRLLRALVERAGITPRLSSVPGAPTTRKLRILEGGRNVVLRVDTEERAALSEAIESEIVRTVAEALPSAGVLVLSDYAKGVFRGTLAPRLVALARARGIPVVVDPKGDDWSRYAGCTLVTPNLHEAVRATARAGPSDADASGDPEEIACVLAARLDAVVVVTCGADGLCAATPDGTRLRCPAVPVTPVSTVGAGDVVVAALALASARALPLETSLAFAAAAASAAIGSARPSVETAADRGAALQRRLARWLGES